MSKIIELKNVLSNPNTALRVAIFNADRHPTNEAFERWESTEPHCVQGMLNAYNKVLDPRVLQNPLSLDIIKEIRQELLIEGGNENLLSSKPERINKMDWTMEEGVPQFGLSTTNTEEVRTRIKQVNEDALELQKELNAEYPPYYALADGNKGKVYGAGGKSEEFTKALIQRYNEAQTVEPSIDNIIKLVRDLERMHPFEDYNCRTFCVLILNLELVKYGFQPALMQNPNTFDYKDFASIKADVEAGQLNMTRLMAQGVAHEQDPINAQWRANITTPEVMKRFDKVTNNVERTFNITPSRQNNIWSIIARRKKGAAIEQDDLELLALKMQTTSNKLRIQSYYPEEKINYEHLTRDLQQGLSLLKQVNKDKDYEEVQQLITSQPIKSEALRELAAGMTGWLGESLKSVERKPEKYYVTHLTEQIREQMQNARPQGNVAIPIVQDVAQQQRNI